MKRYWAILACITGIILCAAAMATEVPPVTAGDFTDTSETAGWIWSFLTVDFVTTAVGWLLTVGVISVLGWLGVTSASKWWKLILFILAGVNETYMAYVRPAKLASADGKLTEDERREAMRQAIQRAKDYALTEGVPFVQSMSVEIMGAIAELLLGLLRGKKEQAVIVPLSDSLQPPLAELQPVTRASTGEVFGSTTKPQD